MRDRDKIVFLAEKLGSLVKQTLQYAYVGKLRYKFNPSGEVIQVALRYPSRGWKILSEEVPYDER